ncbi:hypothetical protein GCK32_012059 [Trichostrongylus colubriformis]|uniref:FERM domain-containing protein n=1 Tax=Trichostrongylus colubriformis TaxID=6319 RepID=A0AAN8EVA7_TRICO
MESSCSTPGSSRSRSAAGLRLPLHLQQPSSSNSGPAVVSPSVHNVRPGQTYVTVQTLTKENLVIVVNQKTKVHDVLWKCGEILEITEDKLFGLALRQPTEGIGGDQPRHEYFFLDPAQKIVKYAPKQPRFSQWHNRSTENRPLLVLYFRVRVYIDQVRLLTCPRALEHYYLQLKDNFLDQWASRHSVSEERCWEMAAYLLELCRAVHQTLLVLSHQNGKIAPLPQLFQEKSVDRVSTSSNNTTVPNNCDNDRDSDSLLHDSLSSSGDRGQGSVSSKQRVRIKLDSNLDLKIEKMELEHIRQERAASQSSKTSDTSDQVERKLTSLEADTNEASHDFITHPVADVTNIRPASVDSASQTVEISTRCAPWHQCFNLQFILRQKFTVNYYKAMFMFHFIEATISPIQLFTTMHHT